MPFIVSIIISIISSSRDIIMSLLLYSYNFIITHIISDAVLVDSFS